MSSPPLSPSPSSQQRSRDGNNYGSKRNSGGGDEDQRPRFFDKMVKNMCWAKAETVAGRHPERWRKDAAGNIVCKRFANCHGCLCFEYDHILPFSKGAFPSFSHCKVSKFLCGFVLWVKSSRISYLLILQKF